MHDFGAASSSMATVQNVVKIGQNFENLKRDLISRMVRSQAYFISLRKKAILKAVLLKCRIYKQHK